VAVDLPIQLQPQPPPFEKPSHDQPMFAEDLISDKSLDEVILAFLSADADLEPPK
jgi:hypothetical protein